MLHSVLLHRGLRHVNPELTEFPDETRNTPPNVSTRELPNEFLDFLGHGRAASSSVLAQRGPVIAEALAPPSNHGRRF